MPSQAGLITDARTAWDWVAERAGKNGKAEDNIVVVGHSLGTGVTSALAGQLADEGELRMESGELTTRHLSARADTHRALHVYFGAARFVSFDSLPQLTSGTGCLALFRCCRRFALSRPLPVSSSVGHEELTAEYFKSRNRTPFNSYEAISVSLHHPQE